MLGREDVEWSVLPRVVSKPQHASARLRRVFVRGVLGAAALSRARILALCGPEHARHGADAEMWVRHGTQSGKRSSSNGSCPAPRFCFRARRWRHVTRDTEARDRGFRVKLYMFHADQHGEVLEEALVPGQRALPLLASAPTQSERPRLRRTHKQTLRHTDTRATQTQTDQTGRQTRAVLHPDTRVRSLSDSLESCNGLHYPATDIPQRARDLFLLNHIRF
eukprot:3936483-Rhodomonas_salina.1